MNLMHTIQTHQNTMDDRLSTVSIENIKQRPGCVFAVRHAGLDITMIGRVRYIDGDNTDYLQLLVNKYNQYFGAGVWVLVKDHFTHDIMKFEDLLRKSLSNSFGPRFKFVNYSAARMKQHFQNFYVDSIKKDSLDAEASLFGLTLIKKQTGINVSLRDEVENYEMFKEFPFSELVQVTGTHDFMFVLVVFTEPVNAGTCQRYVEHFITSRNLPLKLHCMDIEDERLKVTPYYSERHLFDEIVFRSLQEFGRNAFGITKKADGTFCRNSGKYLQMVLIREVRNEEGRLIEVIRPHAPVSQDQVVVHSNAMLSLETAFETYRRRHPLDEAGLAEARNAIGELQIEILKKEEEIRKLQEAAGAAGLAGLAGEAGVVGEAGEVGAAGPSSAASTSLYSHEDLQEQLENLTKSEKFWKAQNENLKKNCDKKRAEVVKLTQQVQDLEKELEEAGANSSGGLSRLQAENEQLKQELKGRDTHLNARVRQLEQMMEEKAGKMIDELKGKITRLQTQLRDERDGSKQIEGNLQKELATKTKEVEELKQQFNELFSNASNLCKGILAKQPRGGDGAGAQP